MHFIARRAYYVKLSSFLIGGRRRNGFYDTFAGHWRAYQRPEPESVVEMTNFLLQRWAYGLFGWYFTRTCRLRLQFNWCDPAMVVDPWCCRYVRLPDEIQPNSRLFVLTNSMSLAFQTIRSILVAFRIDAAFMYRSIRSVQSICYGFTCRFCRFIRIGFVGLCRRDQQNSSSSRSKKTLLGRLLRKCCFVFAENVSTRLHQRYVLVSSVEH